MPRSTKVPVGSGRRPNGEHDQILVAKSQDRVSADTLSSHPSGRRGPVQFRIQLKLVPPALWLTAGQKGAVPRRATLGAARYWDLGY
jgi:hypothetical protein